MTQHDSTSPLVVFTSLWRQRNLIWQMTKRDVVGRYRGSVMGLLWSFLNPLLMLGIYTFVFSVVFKARWGQGGESKAEFAAILFSGMIIYTLFSECINRAPSLIISNVNYVKKVVFPLEVLPWVAMGSALFHLMTSVSVLLIFYFIIHFYINWTVILLPLLVLPFVIFIMGLSWFLASLGVYLRDVSQTVTVLTTAMLFLSPVFYPISILPESYQYLFQINPLTFIIEQSRNVVVWGKFPDWTGLALYFVVSIVTAWLGLFWFQKTRKGFADVL